MSSVDNHFALLLGFVESGRVRILVNARDTSRTPPKFLFWNVLELPIVFGLALGSAVWVFAAFWLGLAAGVASAAMCHRTLVLARRQFEDVGRTVPLAALDGLVARAREDMDVFLDLFHAGVVSLEDRSGRRCEAGGQGWIAFVKKIRAGASGDDRGADVASDPSAERP